MWGGRSTTAWLLILCFLIFFIFWWVILSCFVNVALYGRLDRVVKVDGLFLLKSFFFTIYKLLFGIKKFQTLINRTSTFILIERSLFNYRFWATTLNVNIYVKKPVTTCIVYLLSSTLCEFLNVTECKGCKTTVDHILF